MNTQHENPYESPSAFPEPQAVRFLASWRSTFGVLAGLNLAMLLAIVATQPICAEYFQELEVELPLLSRMALGPVLPSIHAVLLSAAIGLHALNGDRRKTLWECALLILLGSVAGYYLIALWLPTAGPHTQLS